MALWSLPLVGPSGAVYSFEPSPANVAILDWHRKANRMTNWTIVRKAVADRDAGECRFYLVDSGDSPMNSLTSGAPGMPLMDGRDVRTTSIPTVSLDTYCRELGVRPQVIKIDVEGAELLVLRGAERLLSEAGPAVILAVQPYWLPAGHTAGQIMDLLRACGYTACNSHSRPASSLRGGEYLCLKA